MEVLDIIVTGIALAVLAVIFIGAIYGIYYAIKEVKRFLKEFKDPNRHP